MKRTINMLTYVTISFIFAMLSLRAFSIREFIMGIVLIIFSFVLAYCAARA